MNGSDFRSTAFTTVNTLVVAPIASVELVLVNASITREQQEEQAAHPAHAFSSRLRRAASTNPARRSASAAQARRPAAVI